MNRQPTNSTNQKYFYEKSRRNLTSINILVQKHDTYNINQERNPLTNNHSNMNSVNLLSIKYNKYLPFIPKII